jgi:hypothetical protein
MTLSTRNETTTEATFTGRSGTAADPTAVTLTVSSSQGSNIYTYVPGSVTGIQKVSTGVYLFRHVPPAGASVYRYEWAGAGAIVSVGVATEVMVDQ